VHIGLNLIYLVPGETGGTEVVARELLPPLVSAGTDMTFTAFVNREAAEAPDGFWRDIAPTVTVPVHARNRVAWVRGEQQLLPRMAADAGVDLVHSLANTGPVWGRFTRVVTIHDLIHRVHPEAHFGLRSFGMRMLVTLAARRSDRVIVDSENTRNDLIRLLRLAPEKIDVAPLGLGSTPSATALAEGELRARYGLGDRPLLLTVSAKRPHKNLMRLLEAIALLSAERRPVLVLPGYPTPHEQELRRRASELGIESDTRFLGWVSDSELEGLYASAACFVFPSLYEGFGMPVLEAMHRAVPVACSDRGALREVAGSAARFFDPEKPAAMAQAIESVLSGSTEAERLRAAGRSQAARFTWQETARATLASYERAVGRPSQRGGPVSSRPPTSMP
jgi:glycosyltransferase involved in cell wall biosynthesis